MKHLKTFNEVYSRPDGSFTDELTIEWLKDFGCIIKRGPWGVSATIPKNGEYSDTIYQNGAYWSLDDSGSGRLDTVEDFKNHFNI